MGNKMEMSGPILNTEHRHNFKHQLDMPHKRDLSKERYTPTYEVDKSHHYRQSRTHKADLSEMQGPIYSKAMSKHRSRHKHIVILFAFCRKQEKLRLTKTRPR